MLVKALLGLVSASAVLATHSTVNIWLKSSWNAPPLVLEVLESIANEDPALYFPLLTALSTECPTLTHQTPEQQLDSILELIRETPELLQGHPKWDLSSFQASIAMHATTPKIQAYYQYYDTAINQTDAGSTTGQLCESWVEWRGKGFCEVEELRKDIELTLPGEHSLDFNSTYHTAVLPFDHIFPDQDIPAGQTPAVLYLARLSKSEGDLLEYLKDHASRTQDFRFIVRYRPDSGRERDAVRTPNSLKGYGVEMVLKRTDYLTIDDRQLDGPGAADQQHVFSVNASSQDKESRYSGVFGQDPWADLAANPVRPTELTDLGLKAASLVMADDTPLDALIDISQDFPKLVAALARKARVNASLEDDVERNQRSMRLGNIIWVNGRFIGPLDANALSLLDIIREERHRAVSLFSLGLTPQQSFEILSDDRIGDALSTADPMDSLVDASDRWEGGKVIQWWNNIEKDSRYAKLPDSISAVLTPQRPGSFQPARKNLWNVVLVMDLSTRTGLQTISQTIPNIIRRGIPFRVGLVPSFNSDPSSPGSVMARLIQHMIKQYGRGETIDFVSSLLHDSKSPTVDLRQAQALFDSAYASSERGSGQRYQDIVQGQQGYDYIDKVQKWLTRLAVNQETSSGHVFFNGQYHPLSDMWFQQVIEDHSTQLAYLQKPAISKLARKAKDISSFFYDLSTTSRRRNMYITPGLGKNRLRVFDIHDTFPEGSPLVKHYVYPSKQASSKSLLSILVIADIDSHAGWQLVKGLLQHISEHPDSEIRVGFQHVASQEAKDDMQFRLSTLVYRLYTTGGISLVGASELLALGSLLENPDKLDLAEQIAKVMQQLSSDSVLRDLLVTEADDLTLAASREFWATFASGRQVMGVEAGLRYLHVNGRLIGPLEADAFEAEDYASLERYELNTRAKPIFAALGRFYQDIEVLDRLTVSNMVNGIAATIGAAYSQDEAAEQPRTNVYRQLRGTYSSFEVGQQSSALVHVYAIIDPLSESAQKIGPLLKMVTELSHTFVHVQLNPQQVTEEIPLKRFYRYAVETKPSFTIEGDFAAAGASFADLPSDPILTLGMDVPHAWLVSPRKSVHDLDNLKLDAILGRQDSPVIDLNFELEQFVIDGHATEGNSPSPPRGLQLQLSSLDGQPIGDTMVMANLGYLQFKANPGVMALGIRDARGREVYSLKSVSSGSTVSKPSPAGLANIYLTSFTGVTIRPVLTRNPGMEQADVLDLTPAPKTGSVFSKVVSSLSTILGSRTVIKHQPHADINIFTVASGLLYERFASIMILSVLKYTKSTVKFWFIENFLSPSFLEFIPHFAEQYGFQYELVTYKWPSWLRTQKEKQREIWGYKILFLDVLFPLNLDKIIFVDADQIVRTDLKELVDLDLEGRVYGYAPMGDDREDMEGFRFWKTGYWHESLRGRPYHISALYVVDLKRFRELAAGDRLRSQYQALSADPNSLANLDQDLPNAMQDILPIYTLDRSWLWCETWCSQESLKDAKTIDLCQNPMTKEPKLDRARKIPEWEEYDREVAAFAKSLQKSNEIAAADVDVLASPDSFAGAKKADAEEEQISEMPAEDTKESLVQKQHQREDKQNDQYRNIDEL